MDVGTHALVPMAAALAALGFARRDAPGDRSRAAVATVFGLAGAAPDLDGLLDGLAERWAELYFLQHRGVSHSLVGAPLFGLILLGLLVLLARVWPRRASLFAFRPAFVPAAIVGSWTHLVLDFVTYSGVPLWWPFSYGRASLHLFGYVVIWLFVPAVLVLVLHGFGRVPRRRVVQAGAVVVVILVLLAGVRLWTRPAPEQEGALVFPRASELEWTVLVPHANGTWEGYLHRLGARGESDWYEPLVPSAAADAVAAARATPAYRGFLMGSFGPEIVRAEPDGAGWNVTFIDVAQRFEATHGPRWTPAEPFDAWGYVAFRVDGSRVDVLHRGW